MEKESVSPLVSIIVPVYKVEKELDRCVQSILGQTYKNLEIILIDDGSPDKCPEMCDEYAQKDGRIKVIHKRNGGLSDARNAGLDIAKGEYFAFIDSDDWVAENFIEHLVTNMEATNSDISICGYIMVNTAGEMRHYAAGKDDLEIFEHDAALHELFAQQKFGCMICLKVYRHDLFEDVRFPKGKLYEDIAVSLPLFEKSKRCVLSDAELYYYFQRDSSIVNSKFSKRKLDMLEFVQKMVDYSHEKEHRYDRETEAFYLKAVLMNILQAYKEVESKEARKSAEFLKKELKKHRKFIWGNEYIEKRRQLVMYAIILNFPAKILIWLWETRMKAKYE